MHDRYIAPNSNCGNTHGGNGATLSSHLGFSHVMNILYLYSHRHEFHKNCVDPWLKIKHTCPLCKGNITTSKSRNTSTSSSVVTTTTSDDRQRQRRTSSNSVTTPISLSFHSLASSSDSSSGSDTTVTQLNEMRVLTRPAPSAQVAISLEEERESTAPDTEIV